MARKNDEEDFSAADQAVMNKYQRQQTHMEESAEAAEQGMKKFLRGLKRDPESERDLKKKFLLLMQGGRTFDQAMKESGLGKISEVASKGGFTDTGEVITGFEPRPWEDDD